MGAFTVQIEIGDLQGRQYAPLDALVDTGASTTVVPASVLRRLGIEPAMRQTFSRADGGEVELDMGKASVRVEGRETPTWVIFGSEDSGALLGAYTLAGTFLKVDPHNERLIPVIGILNGQPTSSKRTSVVVTRPIPRRSVRETKPITPLDKYIAKITLRHAAVRGKAKKVLRIISAAGLDVNEQDEFGTTALHEAASHGNPLLVHRLITEAGANVDVLDEDGRTPLHRAARHYPNTLQALILAGANVDIADKRGRTPMHVAAPERYGTKAVSLLIDANANVNARDDLGHTPLTLATNKGVAETVTILLNADAEF